MYIMLTYKINTKINNTIGRCGLKTRPNASVACGISFLIPLSILIALIKTPQILTINYKLATIIAAGLIISNIILITQCIKHKNFGIGKIHYCSTVFISFLFYVCMHRGILFSVYSGIFSTILYYQSLPVLLKTFPQSFSFGEAALVTQGTIILGYETTVNIFKSFFLTPTKIVQISTLILQVGVIGLAIILFIAYKQTFFRKTIPFYSLTGFVLIFIIILPLDILLKKNPINFVIGLLTSSNRTIHVLLFWCVCISLATIVLHNQIRKGRKANTVIRKAFHILAFVVFLTGLIDQCSVIYLASGVVFILFVALETLRILNLPPLGCYLQDGFVVMQDEKDAGSVALTPLYLLVGCSLPLWIHPDCCDVTDSAGFNLLPLISGILTIGVGDTFASAIGTWGGKHKWPRSKKTVEGTFACIFSQLFVVLLLFNSGYVVYSQINVAKAILAAVITSVIEANTDQVDNVILPLISYLILY